jgi:enamine deaminase RidA (YjgF/YER057c/UK114 family)
VHVSGTAAVGANGETLHSDDIDQNVIHTMETVRELLSLAGADFSHIVRSHAYFKKPEFSDRFEEWARSRGTPDFPCAYNVCDVCRDDWLFEFECVAFVPVKKAGFVEFRKPSEPIGNKAEHFRTLAKSGLPVPASLAVSGEMARKLSPGSEESQNLLIAFESAFGKEYAGKRYAVRSSSRLEDSDSSSKAGAFRSVMSVSFDWLFPAIMTVKKSLDSGIGPAEYGILIQEYVPLKTFGVAFTSDPEFSSHAIVTEISRGAGEALVSGKNLPDRISFSRNVPIPSEFARAS